MNKNENFCLEKLIELKFHLGHETYSNRISPYILGLREGVSILDLEQRYSLLRRGLIVINELQQRQSTVWWLGTNQISRFLLQKISCLLDPQKVNHNIILTRKWVPGLITNQETFRLMFQRFTQKNKGVAESSRLESKVKLDLKLNRDLDLSIFRQRKKGERFKNLLSLSLQIKGNLLLPDLLFVANPKENRVALKEAHQNNIPTIAFVDSDVDCSLITFPIPINDDNLESIIFCYNLLLKTINSRANVQLQWNEVEYKERKQLTLLRLDSYWNQIQQEHSTFYNQSKNKKGKKWSKKF